MAMISLWFNFISVHYFTLLWLLNVMCCFSFVQRGCNIDEHSALLQFKKGFMIEKFASKDPFAYPKVSSWAEEGDERSNCCSWNGVECDEDSGHVIALDLNSSCLYGSINSNSSLFRLVHLERLDLSDNHFNFSEIPSRLGHDLTGLRYLNLSKSSFFGQIPSEISRLSKLSTLDLSWNYDSLTFANLLELEKGNFRSLVQNLTNLKQLRLSKVHILSTLPDILVNASSLISLRLERCSLYGEFPVGIFHLPNLEVLDVEWNLDLTGYIPDLNGSSPFKELNVALTNFSGHLPTSIGNLQSLHLLDIAYCNFYPHVPSSLGNLTQLGFLGLSFFFDHSYTYFDLSRNNIFSGQVSESWSWVEKLTKLYHLGLSYTYLRADFPCFVANLTQLTELVVGYNQITGPIPSCLMKLTHLTALSLRVNNLQGTIPRSLFQLKNLEYLDLTSNNLSGLLEFDEFSQLKKLRILRLSFNQLSLHIKTGLSDAAQKYETLALGSCNLIEFPEFLKNDSRLVELDVSDNYIHGQIPNWMWNSSRETLLLLNLSHNFLTGFEQNPAILPWENLFLVELGFNEFQGSLPNPPSFIGSYSVPNNDYSGEISPLFCNLNYLHVLDLSNNNLSGMLPQCLGKSSAFEILKLYNNSFHGNIPEICPNGDSLLKMVDLSYNQLNGELPRSMANCTKLEFLDLGNNQISDIFPSGLGALPVLRVLILRTNGFHGAIGKPASDHVFPKLCIIDLSNNGFSSMLPSNYLENWSCMKYVDEDEQTYFQHTFWVYSYALFHYDYSMTIFGKGVELQYSKTPYLLSSIDLSGNSFEGEIPGSIGNLRGLHLLNLSNNTLTGLIASSLGNLTALESLDLSHNQLSGTIPSDLELLTFLAYFNVSHNHLWGPISQGQQFDTFQEDSYKGNSDLCGRPLPKICEDSESSTPPPPSRIEEDDEDSGFQIQLDWFVVVPGVVSGLIVGVIAGNIWTAKKHDWFVDTFSWRMRQTKSVQRRRERNRDLAHINPCMFHVYVQLSENCI